MERKDICCPWGQLFQEKLLANVLQMTPWFVYFCLELQWPCNENEAERWKKEDEVENKSRFLFWCWPRHNTKFPPNKSGACTTWERLWPLPEKRKERLALSILFRLTWLFVNDSLQTPTVSRKTLLKHTKSNKEKNRCVNYPGGMQIVGRIERLLATATTAVSGVETRYTPSGCCDHKPNVFRLQGWVSLRQ